MPTQQPHLNKLRRDKFILVLTIPNILKKIESRNVRENEYINLDSLQFSVYNLSIPRVSVPEHPLHYGGQNYNVTSYNRPAYPPVPINFEVDNEFKNYWVLWKWLQLLQDPIDATYAGETIFPGGAPSETPALIYNYNTDIVAYALDEYENYKAKFTFKNAFITELGELAYNYRDTEQLQSSFTFVFNQMNIELVD